MSVAFGLEQMQPRKFIIVIAISCGGESCRANPAVFLLAKLTNSPPAAPQSLLHHMEKSPLIGQVSSPKRSESLSRLPVSFAFRSC
jgi:hypothetical protein